MSRRRHSKIDKLEPSVKNAVEEMILSSNFRYWEIAEYIADTAGEEISQSAICRYARGLCADMQAIHIAQENFKAIMQECAKYPDIDTTEGIVQISSNLMMTAVRSLTPEQLQNSDPLKIMKQATELVRAASYKRNLEMKNKDIAEAGFDEIKQKFFIGMQKDDPELYNKVAEYIERQKGSDNNDICDTNGIG